MSGSPGFGAGVTLPSMHSTNVITPPPVGTSPTPGLNTFVNGMHSFRYAENLQFYLEQLGGPGSNPRITDVFHAPYLSPNNVAQAGQLTPRTPSSANGGGHFNSVVSVSSAPRFGLTPQGTPTPPPPLQPGYERKTYIVICEMHRRQNTMIGQTSLTSLSPVIRQPDVPGERINFVQISHCDICRGFAAEDLTGRLTIFPDSY